MSKFILPFSEIRRKDIPLVGGKTASLGELMHIGMPVPNGFAITSKAYEYFIKENKLEKKIRDLLKNLDTKNINQLQMVGERIRKLIKNSEFPDDLKNEILKAFKKLGSEFVAVRSSATAEDLPDASFAGLQETFLNVNEKNLLTCVKECFASLFTDRAISYREDKHFDHFRVALSVAVQHQIFSESSGVMFTIDPDSGHENFIVINSGFGLGDYIVQGRITPDEIWVFKKTCKVIDKKLGKKDVMEIRSKTGVKEKRVPKEIQNKFSITDKDAERLANYALSIEKHYKCPMDIEWAKERGKLYILQARPETVHSGKKNVHREYKLKQKGKIIATGMAIGRKISSGRVNIVKSPKGIKNFKKGQILVTRKTDPDWEPIMKIASGIVTEEGGRTSHCAIVSRELGVPAVIGVENAMRILKNGESVTIDCSHENGKIWKGELKFSVIERANKIPKTRTKVYVNIGEPDNAVDVSLLPVDGVGLAREEFIITSSIGTHPLEMIRRGRQKEFVEKLAYGIAKIAASFYPRPVIVRLSDFKTNEYRNMEGGEKYEPVEDNPMIGWRGASRYIDEQFKSAFKMELKAMKKTEEMGLDNVKIMIPFCRTIEEAKRVLKIIRSEKIRNEVYVMAEIPSNVILADEFSKLFNGFSIGSNDLTQLTLGIDRDNKMLAKEFDERNEAVKRMISQLISVAHKYGRSVGICGDAPSTHEDYAEFLVERGIDSISVMPDVAIKTKLKVAKFEKKLKKR